MPQDENIDVINVKITIIKQQKWKSVIKHFNKLLDIKIFSWREVIWLIYSDFSLQFVYITGKSQNFSCNTPDKHSNLSCENIIFYNSRNLTSRNGRVSDMATLYWSKILILTAFLRTFILRTISLYLMFNYHGCQGNRYDGFSYMKLIRLCLNRPDHE